VTRIAPKNQIMAIGTLDFSHLVIFISLPNSEKNEKPITFIDLLTLFSFLGYFRLSTGHDPTCTKLVSPSSQLPLQAAAAASTRQKCQTETASIAKIACAS